MGMNREMNEQGNDFICVIKDELHLQQNSHIAVAHKCVLCYSVGSRDK